MSRTLKFRAWDGMRMTTGQFQFNNTTGEMEALPDVIIMQFTGLLDKNSKEIYERDIVKISDEGGEERCVIRNFIEDTFFLKNRMRDAELGKSHPLGREQFEIIGNIYENSELLKS